MLFNDTNFEYAELLDLDQYTNNVSAKPIGQKVVHLFKILPAIIYMTVDYNENKKEEYVFPPSHQNKVVLFIAFLMFKEQLFI